MKNSLTSHFFVLFLSLVLAVVSLLLFIWLRMRIDFFVKDNQLLFTEVTHAQAKQQRSGALEKLISETERERQDLKSLFLSSQDIPDFLQFLEQHPLLRATHTSVTSLAEASDTNVLISLKGVGSLREVIKAIDMLSYLPYAATVDNYTLSWQKTPPHWQYSAQIRIIRLSKDLQ